MSKALKIILAFLVGILAIYGAVTIMTGFLFTESRGREAGKAVQPFVSGMASAMKNEAKQKLANTPDSQLEKEAYDLSRKMYPVVKGTLLGQMDAFVKDPKRGEFPAKMREAGKAVSEEIVRPFAEGLAEGSGMAIGNIDRAVQQGVRKLQDKNKDLMESIVQGLNQVKRFLEQNTPSQPPGPGTYPQSPGYQQHEPPAGTERGPGTPMRPDGAQ